MIRILKDNIRLHCVVTLTLLASIPAGAETTTPQLKLSPQQLNPPKMIVSKPTASVVAPRIKVDTGAVVLKTNKVTEHSRSLGSHEGLPLRAQSAFKENMGHDGSTKPRTPPAPTGRGTNRDGGGEP